MKSVQQEVDERSNLTGTNKFELLLFRLGGDENGDFSELFGINVFKIREIVAMPTITAVAGSPGTRAGRGQPARPDHPGAGPAGIAGVKPKTGLNIMLVTEFARTTQAFAVESVEEIVRLDWSQVMSAEHSAGSGMVTSIARLPETDGASGPPGPGAGRRDHPAQHEPGREGRESSSRPSAQDQPQAGFGHPGGRRFGGRARPDRAGPGRHGPALRDDQERQGSWEQLNTIAAAAEAEGKTVYDKVALVLTDLEMPEMDGFTLTRNIKKNARFGNLPVVIHSSLSGTTNEEHVKNVRRRCLCRRSFRRKTCRGTTPAAPRSRSARTTR
jgi:two-component system chemotaxis response regulator CheV